MKAYTIDQIAHFDRCLFPYDLRDDLIRHGAPEGAANAICDWLVPRSRASIVSVYQEFVLTQHNDDGLAQAIDKTMEEFFSK